MNLTSKCLLAMKLTIILLTAAFLQVSAKGTAQGITISGKEIPLEQVFAQIEKQTNFSFFYRDDDLARAKKVTIDLKDASLEQALNRIFKDQSLSYSIIGKTIVVKQKEEIKKQVNDVINNVSPPVDVHGRIVDENGKPANASVTVKGTSNGTTTNPNGEFVLRNIADDAVLVISGIGIETFEIKVNGKSEITATAKIRINEEEGVIINTGYQKIKPNEATGSFSVVNNELFNRSPNSEVILRLQNIVPGMLVGAPQESKGDNPYGILIRGRSSIYSSVAPLIVLDNFPYDGDLSNLNPNDVESITVLKDAAAASIWGARAGNGVIVITTKKGTTNKPQVSFNSNISVNPRPDLSKLNWISSSDEIDLEKYWFNLGYYNSTINSTKDVLSPVQEILLKQRNGQITSAQADAQINAFKNIDVRTDLEKYFYRPAIAQRNSLSVSGNSANVNYYMSAGWDHNSSYGNLYGLNADRITLKTQNSFRVTRNFQIDAGIQYTQKINKSGNNPGIDITTGKGLYPYADLVDDNGNALTLAKDYRSGYTDTAGHGNLPTWKYKPLDDINTTQKTTKLTDLLVNTSFRYKFTNFLNAEIDYRFQNSISNSGTLNTEDSYYTRNLINRFYQPNAASDKQFPIPIGGIFVGGISEGISHQGRVQLNFNKTINQKHLLNALAGWEIKDLNGHSNSYTLYGYNRNGTSVNTQIDFLTYYKQFDYSYKTSRIPNSAGIVHTLDRFISYYANAFYSYENRYTVSASGREDAANLFGVKTNQKGVPLWSTGLAWNASNESFYNISWLPVLKLRATYGYNGNFSRATSAFATASFQSGTPSIGIVNNPPNENLRWERVRTTNLGLDFQLRNKRITGSIEYWEKNAKDLMAQAPIDPTTGLNNPPYGSSTPSFFGNVASMKGHGYDIELNSLNIDSKVRWQSTLLFSYALNTVSQYLLPAPTSPFSYMSSGTITPIIGKPLYTIYSYAWAGLDPNTGDPRGYYGKTVSTDWNKILNKTSLDSLIYNGPVQPPYFGALRNTFGWKNIVLSFNFSYRFGYYLRKSSINYVGLFDSWMGNSDYGLRWQKSGDEKNTYVPSLANLNSSFANLGNRQNFYQYSDVLVIKGDNIRLQDVSINYTISKSQWTKNPFQSLSINAYTGLDILLWKANKMGIDPVYPNGNINRKNFTIGLNANF